MKYISNNQYYLWDCNWCDSSNRTPWTRIREGKVVCGACHTSSHISVNGHFLLECA